jgi:hypothetical protein
MDSTLFEGSNIKINGARCLFFHINAGVMKTWLRSSLRLFPVYLEFVEIPVITV